MLPWLSCWCPPICVAVAKAHQACAPYRRGGSACREQPEPEPETSDRAGRSSDTKNDTKRPCARSAAPLMEGHCGASPVKAPAGTGHLFATRRVTTSSQTPSSPRPPRRSTTSARRGRIPSSRLELRVVFENTTLQAIAQRVPLTLKSPSESMPRPLISSSSIASVIGAQSRRLPDEW